LAELLDEEGFEVHAASNGFSGLRLAAETRPHVILLDLVLPEVSGHDMLRELRENPSTRDAAIVIVSGNADSLVDQQLAEVDAVVRKPFDVAILLSTLHQAVQRAAHRLAEVQPVTPTVVGHDRPQRTHLAAAIRRSRGRRI
jgi:CheY-like chemotaxis protein